MRFSNLAVHIYPTYKKEIFLLHALIPGWFDQHYRYFARIVWLQLKKKCVVYWKFHQSCLCLPKWSFYVTFLIIWSLALKKYWKGVWIKLLFQINHMITKDIHLKEVVMPEMLSLLALCFLSCVLLFFLFFVWLFVWLISYWW